MRGEEHKTGQADTEISFDRLETAAHAYLDIHDVELRWSAQNYSPADGLPYIGRDPTDCFIATGFETDGLTYGTLAASLIADQIAGRDNAFAPIVKASRFQPLRGAKGMLEENVTVMKSFIKDYVTDRKTIPPRNSLRAKAQSLSSRRNAGRIQRPDRRTIRGLAGLHAHEVQSPLE